MKKKTLEALAELARAAARHAGWSDDEPIEFTVCRPKLIPQKLIPPVTTGKLKNSIPDVSKQKKI